MCAERSLWEYSTQTLKHTATGQDVEESVGMQKQVEDMFLSECSGEEAKARIKFLGPEGLHTMRAEVEQNTQHKEGAVKRTYQHVLQNAFKEHVFRHKTEEATFLPVISAYSL